MNVTISVWWIAIFAVLLLGVVGWVKAGAAFPPTGGTFDFSGALILYVRLFVTMGVLIGLLAIFAIKGCVGW